MSKANSKDKQVAVVVGATGNYAPPGYYTCL
jgi:hypothetical protein